LSGAFFQCKEPPEIIEFDLAVAEIVFYNYNNQVGSEAWTKTRTQLLEGFMVNTPAFIYTLINPNKDLLDNIDDGIDLDKEGEFF
jgi:hypothetical protein